MDRNQELQKQNLALQHKLNDVMLSYNAFIQQRDKLVKDNEYLIKENERLRKEVSYMGWIISPDRQGGA